MAEFKNYEPGTVCFAEPATNNPAASGKFHTEQFGWDRSGQDLGDVDEYILFNRGGGIGLTILVLAGAAVLITALSL